MAALMGVVEWLKNPELPGGVLRGAENTGRHYHTKQNTPHIMPRTSKDSRMFPLNRAPGSVSRLQLQTKAGADTLTQRPCVWAGGEFRSYVNRVQDLQKRSGVIWNLPATLRFPTIRTFVPLPTRWGPAQSASGFRSVLLGVSGPTQPFGGRGCVGSSFDARDRCRRRHSGRGGAYMRLLSRSGRRLHVIQVT